MIGPRLVDALREEAPRQAKSSAAESSNKDPAELALMFEGTYAAGGGELGGPVWGFVS